MIFVQVTEVAGEPPLRDWIASVLRLDMSRRQQRAHLPRVARVLRRPNLAAAPK